ncbi:hypothetical protein [Geothrix sp.]|jgi:hypothetical protein|uniref:hypothetical protein n=1 Tax=Geothrix sp. TaxID=1962974 RepID=UPI0025C3E5F8|nr:hypothetical protein [Geothrix sp.]
MHKIKMLSLIRFFLSQSISVLMYTIIFLAGCSGSRSSNNLSNEVDIYVAGYEFSGDLKIAKYWKNGIPALLSNGVTAGVATSIFCNQSDLYIVGREFDENLIGPVAKIWKNGLQTALTDGSTDAEINSVWISGNDVYVAGGEAAYAPNVGANAEYWKNTNKVKLTDGTHSAMARAITVSDGNVYVAGDELEIVSTGPITNELVSVARIWKNGIPMTLDLKSGLNSGATGTVVTGSDVYVVGWETENTGYGDRVLARLWKNGQLIPMTGNEDSIATSIAISSNDIYVVGYKYIGNSSVAMCWKNGQGAQLADGKVSSIANSIAILGGNVYIAGFEGNYAKYWINGTSRNLTNGKFSASANSIFIIQRKLK